MKCEFDYEKGSLNKWTAIMLVMLFVGIIIILLVAGSVYTPDYAHNFSLLSIMIFAVLWGFIAAIRVRTLEGIIMCGHNSIAICRKHRKWIIPFNNIESISCMPELVHTKYAVKYYLVFTATLKTGKKLALYQQLDVEKSLPVQQPEKFKEYIDEQPMTKLYEYIKRKVG